MNWCKPHWDELRAAIEAKGLLRFCAASGEELADRIQQPPPGDDGFEPLMGCWSRINETMANSLKNLGRGHEILQLRCPCCILVEDGQPDMVQRWIDGCTNDALNYAIEQGLIAKN